MKKRFFALWAERFLSAIKYLLAIFMMVAGVMTAFAPIDPSSAEALGWLYNSRHALVFYGASFFASGFALLWGKIRKSRKWTGRGLLLIYLSFLYAAMLNGVAWGFMNLEAWLPNVIMACLVGALYLRWRFQTEYINPKHFTRDLELRHIKGDYERH